MSAPEVPTIDEMQATYDSFCAAVDKEDLLGAQVYAAVCADHVAKLLKAKPTRLTWRPIETAPKDGTQVLLWINGIEPRPRISFWSERGSDSGWYSVQSHHFIASIVTHWMPLPEPPKERER